MMDGWSRLQPGFFHGEQRLCGSVGAENAQQCHRFGTRGLIQRISDNSTPVTCRVKSVFYVFSSNQIFKQTMTTDSPLHRWTASLAASALTIVTSITFSLWFALFGLRIPFEIGAACLKSCVCIPVSMSFSAFCLPDRTKTWERNIARLAVCANFTKMLHLLFARMANLVQIYPSMESVTKMAIMFLHSGPQLVSL